MELPLVEGAFDLLALDEAVGEARLPVSAGVVRGENLSAEAIATLTQFSLMSEGVDQAVRDEEAVEDAELFLEF